MSNRENTTKAKVVEFVTANPGLKRKQYIEHFVNEFGMTNNSASLYHYLYVTKVNKQSRVKVSAAQPKGPVRDPKTGRYVKRAA